MKRLGELMLTKKNWRYALPWDMFTIALAGKLINSERNKWTFLFGNSSNFYMFVIFWLNAFYAQSILFFIYFLLAILESVSWTKKERQLNPKIHQQEAAQ